jgi:hypothetical protein
VIIRRLQEGRGDLIHSMLVDALLTLSQDNKELEREVREIGGIPVIISLLSSSIPSVKTNAAGIIR